MISSTTVTGIKPLNAELNTSLDISKNQFINLSFNASRQKSYSNSSTDIQNIVGGITTDSFYESERRRVSPDLSAMLTYNYDFGKEKNKTFIASYLYAISPWREEYNQKYKDENEDITKTEQDISESIDYNHKLDLFFNHTSKNLRFNLNGGFLNKGYNTVTYENQTLSTETTLKHTIVDLSSNIHYNFHNKLTLSGTCYLNYQINDEISEMPFLYSGSVNLSYLLNKKIIKSLTVGYNRSQNRPAFAQLSNYRSKSDPYSVSIGNYNLKPENLNSLLLSFKLKNSASYMLSYIFSNNKIETVYRNDNGVMTKTFENSGLFKSLKISTLLAYFKQGKYRANGNISAQYSNTCSRTNLSSNRILLKITGNINYLIQKTFGINCDLFINKYFDWGSYRNSSNMPIDADLGIIYGKMKGKAPVWTFETYVNFFTFGRSKYTSNIKETNFEYFQESTSQFRIPVGFKFTFHIGHFEVSPRTTNQKASVRGYSM